MKSAWTMLALIGFTWDVHAVGTLADVEVLDRETGSVLPTYRHHGEYWIAGRPGARFSIMIRNHGSTRLLAVTAVDGINVISGETSAFGQTGYVFDPGEGYQIAGWRKSRAEVADFNFTTASDSYAARTDRPANVGVIGVFLFTEQESKIAAAPAPPPDAMSRSSEAATSRTEQSARSAAAQNFASVAPKLGTGHGAREVSYVRDVPFDRSSNSPNEIIRIRYDSFDNLVAMGVVPRYVPDPPGG